MAKKNAYVVFVGRKPGVYESWGACEAQVKGHPGAVFQGYSTYEDAVFAYKGTKEKEETSTVIEEQVPLAPSISVDVGTRGNPGKMEYRIVWTHSGEVIYHSPVYPLGTNNIGEFLAVVKGIQWMRQIKGNFPIYSDSVTALSWVRDKRYKTSLPRNEQTESLYQLMDEAIAYLEATSPYPHLYKWNTRLQGEIKADFGRK